jgi:hypothetical protein
MIYKVRWKRWFWHSRKVSGHRYDQAQDKLVLYYPDGSIEEVVGWSKCAVKLEVDWVNAAKKHIENQAGQVIPLKV